MGARDSEPMLIRSRAPLRISFCGGGTDIPPYPQDSGGCVLSATIDKYCHATIEPTGTDQSHVTSLDFDSVTHIPMKKPFDYNGNLDLIKATFKVMNISDGMVLFIHSDAPPGT